MLLLSPGAGWAVAAETADPLPKERITLFNVTATLHDDGTMRMEEQLTFVAEGHAIKHGLTRELPLLWNRADGKTFQLAYFDFSAELDDRSTRVHVARDGTRVIIQAGDAARRLPDGEHTLTLRYTVANHFSRFSQWDEIYWNVTGHEWRLWIERAAFRLVLPSGMARLYEPGTPAPKPTPRTTSDTGLTSGTITQFPQADPRLLSIDAYTGPKGEKGRNAHILANGEAVTTRPLPPGEGLTVAYTFSTNLLAHITAPQPYHAIHALFTPSAGNFLYLLPGALMFAFAWWRVGILKRRAGVIPTVTPLFTPPPGISPGMLRYARTQRYDADSLAGDLLDLCARGVLYLYPAAPPQSEDLRQALPDETEASAVHTRIERRFGTNAPLILSRKALPVNANGEAAIPIPMLAAWVQKLHARRTPASSTAPRRNTRPSGRPVPDHAPPGTSPNNADILRTTGLSTPGRDAAILSILFGASASPSTNREGTHQPRIPLDGSSVEKNREENSNGILLVDGNLCQPLRTLRQSLGSACRREGKGLFLNWRVNLLGLFPLAALLPVLYAVTGWHDAAAVSGFTLAFLLCCVCLFSLALAQCLQGFRRRSPARALVPLLFSLLFLVGGLIPPAFMLADKGALFPPGSACALLLCAAAPIAFTLAAPKYSAKGLKRRAIEKGLLLFIHTAEKNRFEALYPPGTPTQDVVRHFESLLPYALALDAATTWADGFADYMARSGAVPERMAAVSGEHGSRGLHGFSHACSASSASSGSGGSSGGSSGSGSGGGGSSGGGAGGGGGGGW